MLTLVSRKVSSKNRFRSTLSLTKETDTTISNISRVELSVFCSSISTFRTGKLYFFAKDESMALTLLLLLIKTDKWPAEFLWMKTR